MTSYNDNQERLSLPTELGLRATFDLYVLRLANVITVAFIIIWLFILVWLINQWFTDYIGTISDVLNGNQVEFNRLYLNTIVTIIVIILGFGSLMGKVSWGQSIISILGLVIFSALFQQSILISATVNFFLLLILAGMQLVGLYILAMRLPKFLWISAKQKSELLIDFSQLPQYVLNKTQDSSVVMTSKLDANFLTQLEALSDIQEVHNTLLDKEFIEPKIQIDNKVSSIQIIGLGDAIRANNETITPERRKDSRAAHLLDLGEHSIKNVQQKIETEILIREVELEHIEALDAEERRLRRDKLREELRQSRINLLNALDDVYDKRLIRQKEQMGTYMELASNLIKMWKPDATLEEVVSLTTQLIPPLQKLAESPRNLRIGSQDTPRPPTLPEDPSDNDQL